MEIVMQTHAECLQSLENLMAAVDDGRIFSVTFVKRTKDGKPLLPGETPEVRDMLARRHVKKGVKGVGLKFNPIEKGLLSVYDMEKAGFRFVNCCALIKAKVDGTEYDLTGYNVNL